ncbi:MAG: hypothetical protein QG599_292 [Pseudomonadota bacterium]|nr:hypothetical protein [Pseudomonadota bacterium]
MSRTHFDSLLSRVGELIGVYDLAADSDGYCLVRIDDQLDLSIEFSEDADSAILSAACGVLPELPSPGLLAEILGANYYWIGSGGGTLALHGHSHTLYLQFREPLAHLDAARLKDLLEALVINAEAWSRKLHDAADAPASSTPAQATVPAPTMDPLTLHAMRV